jgi:hypothetical protein
MKGMTPITLTIAILIIPLLSACAYGAENESLAPERALAFDGGTVEESVAISDTDLSRTALELGQAQERLIIRSGQLNIVTRDTEETLEEISRMADGMGGWVVSSNVYQRGRAKAGTITIRIPAEQFDTATSQIKDAALEVTSESTHSQDVTEEYVDLEARLANLEATADRVRNFLDEARNVEEALAVNQELSRLEGELESLKGRMVFLNQSAAFSSLTIDLTPDELSQPIEIAGWRPGGVAKSAIEALISAFQGVANVAIWGFLFCLPLGLLVGIPLFFIGRFVYRRRRRLQTADEEE